MSGEEESELVSFFYEDTGMATLEDGLYVLESKLADPVFVARMGRFLKASLKGWNEAVVNPAEAVRIVVALDKSGKASEIATRRANFSGVSPCFLRSARFMMQYSPWRCRMDRKMRVKSNREA